MPKRLFYLVFLVTLLVTVVLLIKYFLLVSGTKKDFLNKSLSSCLVLEEKNCKGEEVVFIDGEEAGLGFNLPIGALVYAPYDGGFISDTKSYIPKKDGSTQKYSTVVMFPLFVLSEAEPTKKRTFSIVSESIKWLVPAEKNILKGEVIGRVESDTKMPDVSNYNSLFVFADYKAQTVSVQPENFSLFFNP